MRPIIPVLAAALAAAVPASAMGQRAFSTEHLLSMEGVGRARISPDGQWVAVERRGPWNSASSYRFGNLTSHLLSRLEVSRRDGDVPALVLKNPGAAAGYLSGPFSPDGRRMVVYRLTEDTWRLGVLSFPDLQVRWFDITPEYPLYGQTVAWRSDTELVLVAREADDLPLFLRMPGGAQEEISALWRTAANGHAPSGVFVTSGSTRNERARSRPARLIRLNVETGEDRVLARGDFFDLEISPDGRSVAAMKNGEDYQIGPDVPASTGEWLSRRRLVLSDLETGHTLEPLPGQDFITHLMTWSPDSRRLIAFARTEGRAFRGGRFWSITAGGESEALDLGNDAPWIDATWDGIPLAFAGWDGRVPVVQVRSADGARLWRRLSPGDDDRSAQVAAPGERLVWANDQLMVLNGSGLSLFGGRDSILTGFSLAGRSFDGGDRRNHNPDPVWLGRQPLVNQAGCITTARTTRPHCLAEALEGEMILAAAAQDPALVTRRRSTLGATTVTLRTPDEARRLFTVNPTLEDLDWGEVIPVRHAGPDGAELTSWLLLPPERRTTPSPVVIMPYPGDIHAEAPGSLQPGTDQRHVNPHVLAAAGYAVLVPSLPYDRHPADLRDIAPQLETVLDAAAEAGWVDPDRAALVGHSFGAQTVLRVATQTDRFRAIIASNGYADLANIAYLRLYWRAIARDGVPITTMSGWAETGQGGVGVPFASDPLAYVDHSPLYAAGRIVTPTLLIESDLDGARLGGLFGVLYRLNREAGLLTVFGEGHSFASPGNVRDLHDHVLAWLDRYLAPSALDPGQPGSQPGLQNRGDQPAIAGRAPD
ncbi:S9 family peptidase [Brevundimonas sp. BAL450]|uniref:prolyl oligopeptidase family serine peptidase n=1 Tax=Brevundimonas sp. BAL450 TaxID=1708162 RepID=UPI0018C9D276|nr:prolyl oligopeptidase family serine peptidase [Brevundimonas sp. BAL450]MBG7614682.1 S9 family peptidase [Brevundimonas sp. BAL450]